MSQLPPGTRVDGMTVLMRNKRYGITASSCRQDWSLSTDTLQR